MLINNEIHKQRSAPIELHPLPPFLPPRAKLLMLGSFPPPKARWSIEFFYPNFQNDMWRILAAVFYEDRNRFVVSQTRSFDKCKITDFCLQHGIALFDTAKRVRRLRDNASDKFLEVVEPTDLNALLKQIPLCENIVVTGQKAADTLSVTFQCAAPSVGKKIQLELSDRKLQIWRMPSSSRAYPLAFGQKAATYKTMFQQIGMIP